MKFQLTCCVTFLTILSALFFLAETGTAVEGPYISGEVHSGFRILAVDPTKTDSSFTVYRGDYIKVSYPESYDQLMFAIEELNYSGKVSPNFQNALFFKMKKAGTYSFTLGKGGGSIEVVELVRPNYVELTAEEAADLLQKRKPFILDVRTKKEYEQLHLKDSHLIPIQELQSRIGELQNQKYEDIFVYCATGNRSTVASKILADAGFKRIYNLRYGIYDWARKGFGYDVGK